MQPARDANRLDWDIPGNHFLGQRSGANPTRVRGLLGGGRPWWWSHHVNARGKQQ
jgi:hypothetical protein